MSSRETAGIIAFAKAFDPTVIVTSTTTGKHATGSYHFKPGSGGVGRAVDFDFVGIDRANRRLALARHFETVGNRLAELFYTPLGRSWRYGRKVAWTVANHLDHVHVAVELGVVLTSPSPPEEDDEMDMKLKVGAARAPEGGTWVLQRDGGVEARNGAPFLGSYPGLKPEQRQGERYFVAIEARGTRNSDGYVLIASDGNLYHFPV